MSFLEDTLTGPSPATPRTSFLFSPIIPFPLQTPWVAFLKSQWPALFLLPTSQKRLNLNYYAWPLNKFCSCLGDISITLLLSLQVQKNLKQVLTYSFSLNWFLLSNWRPPNRVTPSPSSLSTLTQHPLHYSTQLLCHSISTITSPKFLHYQLCTLSCHSSPHDGSQHQVSISSYLTWRYCFNYRGTDSYVKHILQRKYRSWFLLPSFLL